MNDNYSLLQLIVTGLIVMCLAARKNRYGYLVSTVQVFSWNYLSVFYLLILKRALNQQQKYFQYSYLLVHYIQIFVPETEFI